MSFISTHFTKNGRRPLVTTAHGCLSLSLLLLESLSRYFTMIAKKSFVLQLALLVNGAEGFLSAAPALQHARCSMPHAQAMERAVRTPSSAAVSSSTYQGPQGQEWIQKSIEYYTKVMRMEDPSSSQLSGNEQSRVAKRLYSQPQRYLLRAQVAAWSRQQIDRSTGSNPQLLR